MQDIKVIENVKMNYFVTVFQYSFDLRFYYYLKHDSVHKSHFNKFENELKIIEMLMKWHTRKFR